jgi:arylsulfatase B
MAQTPKGRGFNTSLGYFNGACDHYTQEDSEDGCSRYGHTQGPTTDLWNTDEPGYGLNGTYGDYMYVGRAVEVITEHDVSTPLFFYLAMQCAHAPMEAPPRFIDLFDPATIPDKGSMRTEYAFSSVIDEGLKNVTTALKAKKMWANTLLVVSSDNGGPSFSDQHAASNYPLRGGKYTFFEGGVRVNAFVSGGLLPAGMRGKNITAPIHICDWCLLRGIRLELMSDNSLMSGTDVIQFPVNPCCLWVLFNSEPIHSSE